MFKNRHFFSSEKKNNVISIYNLYNKKRVFPSLMPKSSLTMVGGNDLVSFSMFKNSETKNKLISISKILKSCLEKKTFYEKIVGKEAMSLYNKKRVSPSLMPINLHLLGGNELGSLSDLCPGPAANASLSLCCR